MMSMVCPILEKPPLSPSLKSLLSIPLSFRTRKKNFRFSAQRRPPFPPKRKTLFRRKSHLLSTPIIIRKGRESGKLYFPTTFSYEFQNFRISEFQTFRLSDFHLLLPFHASQVRPYQSSLHTALPISEQERRLSPFSSFFGKMSLVR